MRNQWVGKMKLITNKVGAKKIGYGGFLFAISPHLVYANSPHNTFPVASNLACWPGKVYTNTIFQQ